MLHRKENISRLLRRLVTMLLTVAMLSSTAFAAKTINGAYTEDYEKLLEEYCAKYSWDKDSISSFEWDVNYSRSGAPSSLQREVGYQKQFYDDNLLTTLKYLGIDIGGSGGGGNIVAVALAEVGAEGSLEVPGGSDKVKYNDWFYGNSNSNYAWCCAFVAWCANECGYLDSGLFKKTASCTDMYDYLVNKKGFSSFPNKSCTPFGGTSYTPVPGDIMFFWDDSDSTPFCHIGIIYDVDETHFYVVEGNTTANGAIPGGGVAQKKYAKGSWSACDAGYTVHVEYPKPELAIFNFLTSQMGYTPAAACGVLANIQCESGFKADIEEYATGIGYGLCQWSFGRRTNLENWCNSNGYDFKSVDGQLWFLKYELEGSYRSSTHNRLLGAPNSAQGAYQAGYDWCYYFERPKNYQSVAITRGNLARITFWPQYGSIISDASK